MANGEVKEKFTKEELIETLTPCSAALSIVIAILDDDCHEKVASKVLGIKGSLDLVIYKLKNQNVEE